MLRISRSPKSPYVWSECTWKTLLATHFRTVASNCARLCAKICMHKILKTLSEFLSRTGTLVTGARGYPVLNMNAPNLWGQKSQ